MQSFVSKALDREELQWFSSSTLCQEAGCCPLVSKVVMAALVKIS
jgi:hypothetical protein